MGGALSGSCNQWGLMAAQDTSLPLLLPFTPPLPTIPCASWCPGDTDIQLHSFGVVLRAQYTIVPLLFVPLLCSRHRSRISEPPGISTLLHHCCLPPPDTAAAEARVVAVRQAVDSELDAAVDAALEGTVGKGTLQVEHGNTGVGNRRGRQWWGRARNRRGCRWW